MTAKRRPTYDAAQLAFTFEPAHHAVGDGALDGLERFVASAVSQVLKEDPRSRFEIAGGMSALLNDDVSKPMLDAYSAEAKDTHNVSLARFLALISETQRYDVLDQLCQKIGCHVVVGQEMLTVELGHIESQMQRLQERKQLLRRVAPEITRGGRGR
jgi:hypothetical protein